MNDGTDFSSQDSTNYGDFFSGILSSLGTVANDYYASQSTAAAATAAANPAPTTGISTNTLILIGVAAIVLIIVLK